MSSLIDVFQSDVSIWLSHTLMHSLWQFTLIAIVAVCVERVFAKQNSESAYRIHVTALAFGIATFVATFVWHTQQEINASVTSANLTEHSDPGFEAVAQAMPSQRSQSIEEVPVAVNGSPNGTQSASNFLTGTSAQERERNDASTLAIWVALVYVVGVVFMVLRLLISCRKVNVLRSKATVLTSGRYFDALNALTQNWSHRVKPLIAVSTDVLVPQIVGFTRATILLPASAISGLSSEELDMILSHELAHIRRHDMWIQLVQRLAESVLFFNPALWYTSRRISTLREYCCDDATCGLNPAVESASESSESVQARYAFALLRVAEDSFSDTKNVRHSETGVELASLAAVGHSPSELRRRISRLLGEPMREPMQIPRRSLIAAVGVLTLWMCSFVWSGPAEPPVGQDPVSQVAEDKAEAIDNKPNDKQNDENKPDLKPWQIRIPVTGQIQLPDGSPAANVIVMTASDKFGWGEGFTNGNYTKTDADGRYEIQSKRFFPQRLFWLPEDYENNSRAVTKGGGEQKIVRLKKAPRIKGTIVDTDGRPLEGIVIRANGASRTPMTWAKSNASGEFKFRPLPADNYDLMPVRSYFAHETGQLTSNPLPLPFEYVQYKLTSDSKPVKLVAPETVSVRVKVVNLDGAPVSQQRVSLGDIGDYSNALLASEVDGEPGVYEFQHPKGHYLRDLKVRHSWETIAYYQEKPGLDPIAGDHVVLGKANKDIDGITITVGPSAKLTLLLHDQDGNPITEDFARVNAQISYPDEMHPSNRRVRAPSAPMMTKAKDPSWIEMPGLVPNCDLRLSVYGDKIDDIKQRVRLSPGEQRELTLVVKPRTTATLTGSILTSDGKAPSQKGWIYSRGNYAPVTDQSSTTSRSYNSTVGHFLDNFRAEIPAGTTTIAHFTKDYAPAWLGPIEVEAAKNRDDLKIVLKPGFSFPIHVTDQDGNPIANASVAAFPEINDAVFGPIIENQTDANGVLQYKHAADTNYEFSVKADGYEDIRSERMAVAAGKSIKLTMKESPITSGTVYDSVGRPAPDAKIYLCIKNDKNGRTELAFNEQTLLATTNEDGKFSMRRLSKGLEYLTFVKLLDDSRVLSREILPGAKDLQIHVPERKDLKIKIVGNLNLLSHQKGKPTINVRQRVYLKTEHSAGTLLGTAITVTPLSNGEGGIAVYKGLVAGKVRAYGGGATKTVAVEKEGDAEVTLVLK